MEVVIDVVTPVGAAVMVAVGMVVIPLGGAEAGVGVRGS